MRRKNILNRFVYVSDRVFPINHSFIYHFLYNYLPKHFDEIIIVTIANKKLENNNKIKYIFHEKKNKKNIKGLRKNFILLLLASRNKLLLSSSTVIYVRNLLFAFLFFRLGKKINNNIKCIFQLSHLHSETLLVRNPIKSFGKYLVAKKFRKRCLLKSDFNLLISKEMAIYLFEKKVLSKNLILSLGVNPTVLNFADIKPFIKRKVDLAYIGTTSKERELQVLLRAILLYNKYYGILTLDIWPSDNINDINLFKKQIQLLDLEDFVTVHNNIPHHELLMKLVDIKIGIITIPDSKILETISPIKLMDYMLCGCNIIGTNNNQEISTLIKDSNAGVVISKYSEYDICEAIKFILFNPKESQIRTINAYKYITTQRDYNKMLDKIFKKMGLV